MYPIFARLRDTVVYVGWNTCECGKPKGNRAQACAECRKADLVCPDCGGRKHRWSKACRSCTAKGRGFPPQARAAALEVTRRHGHTWPGGHSPTYGSWSSMKRRCKPDGPYGRKGITVCERWQSFDAFLEDMGVRPDGTTLDRIDGSKGYAPDNCRWATTEEQVANRSDAWATGVRLRLEDREKCAHGHVIAQVGVYRYGDRVRCKACAKDAKARYERRDVDPAALT